MVHHREMSKCRGSSRWRWVGGECRARVRRCSGQGSSVYKGAMGCIGSVLGRGTSKSVSP